MAINFPDSPATNDTFTVGSQTFIFDGTKWIVDSFVGYTGSQGDIGFTGSAGTTGFTGSSGSVGFTGSAGTTGFTGSQGIQGDTGFTGSVGFTGSAGGTDADNVNPLVDAHLNTSTATTNQLLSWNGTDYEWAAIGAGGGSGIEFVDATSTVNSTTLTLPTGLQENDLVLLVATSDLGQQPMTPTGYTAIYDERPSSTGALACYKFMGATPDTQITGLDNSDNRNPHIAMVFRGVDTSNPLDVTFTEINTAGTGMPDPPSITTVTDGCMIVAVGHLDDDDITATAPAGFTLAGTQNSGGNAGATVMAAYALQETAGAIDPGEFGGGGNDENEAKTIALRPSSTGGGASISVNLEDLADVTITSVATNDTLRYDGSAWVNEPETVENFTSVGTGTTIDCSLGNVFAATPSGNVTYTFSNPPASGTAYGFTLTVTPSATISITWPTSVDWAGGTAPTAPASGETDVFAFFTRDGGTTWYGFQSGDAMA